MMASPVLASRLFCRAVCLCGVLAAGPLPAFSADETAPVPVAAGLGAAAAARTEDVPIVAGDVLMLRIGAWDLVENMYQDWTGVGGEVAVQGDGTIMLPFAGNMDAAGRAPGAIAAEISAALRAATGVQSPPTVVVEIARRLPIYVSGDVTTPGAIEFRAGLTVRQAIALAGGPLRVLPGAGTDLLGRRMQIGEGILRADLRIARLEAELAGADSFDVPAGLGEHPELDAPLAVERQLMAARSAALGAQTESVDELIAVLDRVKSGLDEQIGLVEGDLARAEEELSRRRELLDRGLMREMDLSNAEATLSAVRLRLVDMSTQYLTLEKDLSEARRARDALGQTREIEILQELSIVQDRRRDLEVEAALFAPGLGGAGPDGRTARTHLIEAGGVTQVPVELETPLRPGDTLILETGIE